MIEQSLATYRITRLVTEDEIARPFRDFINRKLPDGQIDYLVNCPYCVSVWAALAVLVLPRWLVRALALSGLVSLGREVGMTLGEAVDPHGD